MLAQADEGSALTFPPPPPELVVVVLPLLLSLPPPPHPAAMNASAANRQTSHTALTLCFTLPPPSPVCANGVRLREYPGWGGRAQAGAGPMRCLRGRPSPRTMRGGPKWRNWQTRRTQNPVPFGECGFDSHLRHRTIDRGFSAPRSANQLSDAA